VVRLAPFDERTDPSQSINALIAKIKAETAGISGASILLYNAPPIIGLARLAASNTTSSRSAA
jgi:HAE1 family hydrophobic/amphiphilic exporter-1